MSVTVKSANIIRAKNGSLTLRVNLDDEQSFFLHSTYNPEQEAKEWLENVRLKPKTAYVVLGLGLGYHIKALLAALPEDSHVFSIESPVNGSFLRVVQKSDPKAKWVTDERFTPLIGNDMHDMSGIINKYMQRNGIKRVSLCRHFPSMQIHPEYYAEIEEKVVAKAQELYKLDYSYQISAGSELMTNAWDNLAEIFSAPGSGALKDKFKGMPAIIVAGGPSLDKNINVLKEYVDKAVIICAGSTMGTLHHYGIKPHFLVVVDPFPGTERVFENCLNPETYLLASYTVPNTVINNYPGGKFFCKLKENTPNNNGLNGVQQLLPETLTLHSNISVATTAVSLAVEIGADPIILVGQDLSFSNTEVTHAKGSKAPAYPVSKDDKNMVHVPGFYGGTVPTIPAFKIGIDFFASLFAHVKERQFINATEGGAYLEGAKHMSLQEAADQYIGNTIDVFSILERDIGKSNELDCEELLQFLQECMQCNNDLLEQAAKLLVETDNCPAMIFAGDIEGVEREFAKMDKYFAVVRNSSVYTHLNTYLNPLMQSFFNQEEYDDLEEKFMNYIVLFSYIRIALEKLNEFMSLASSKLQKKE